MTTPVLPPASYPGTAKTFTTKQDGQVIYGEHANEWQEEIFAIESAVGVNPQIDADSQPYASMAARLAHLEHDVVRLEGNQLVHGTKEFADTLMVDGSLIVSAPTTFKYADRVFYVSDAGLQQLTGPNGAAAMDLKLQPVGGQVFRGGNRMWDSGNDGPGSGLDADTLDGHQATDFLLKSAVTVQLGANQTVPFNPVNQNTAPYWRALNLSTVIYEQYNGDGTRLWDSTNHVFHLDVGLWMFSWNMAWEGHNNGSRGVRGMPSIYPPNVDYSLLNAATTFSHQHYMGLAPTFWPITGLTTGNFQDLDQASVMVPVYAPFNMRVDVWNYCDADCFLHANADAHLHVPTTFTVAQLA